MKRVLVLLSITFMSLASLSAQSLWKADQSHSQVKFSVTHMVISEVTGSFREFDATIDQPKGDLFEGSVVQATIKTASVNTDNENRDNHLRGDDFFDAEKHPNITFKSTSFEKTGKDTYKITGMLTMRDSSKSVVIDAKLNGQITDGRGNTRVGFKGTTTIDRFEFGTKWNRMMEAGSLVVGKNVDVTLLFEFIKQKPEADKSK